MRILFISTMETSPWGGSEELWSKAAIELARRGHRVSACVKFWREEPRQLANLRDKGVAVHKRKPRTLPQRTFDRLRSPLEMFLRRVRPELVVVSQGANFDGHLWMNACLSLSIPYACVAHNAIPWAWPDDQILDSLRTAYWNARKAYFVSNHNLTLTERQLGMALSNSKVVRNPFNVPYHATIPWPGEEKLRFGCVARLETYTKGLDLLMDVLDEPKWRTRKLSVTLYGSGPNAGSLLAESSRRNLENLILAGFVPNPVEIWRKVHCLLLPSRVEGLPLVLVEAMLCARPCIVTNVGGNGELLEDGASGFIARNATVADLDEALERAWTAREHLQEMGLRAADRARQVIPPDPVERFVNDVLSLLSATH